MKRLFSAVGVVVALLVSGCSAQPYPPIDAGGQQAAYQATANAARATADAALTEAQRQSAQSTAAAAQVTAQAHAQQTAATAQAEATVITLGIEATRQSMMIGATQAAFEQSIRATAEQRAYQGTATADEWNRRATATAQAMSYAATATRQEWEGARTATAEYAEATERAYLATATRAAAIRDARLASVKDYGIPIALLLLAVGVGVLLVWGIREHSNRPVIIERSLLGDAQPMAVKMDGGGYSFVDLDRQPGPVLKVLPSGVVEAPLLRSAGAEERATARDQVVDAMTRPRLGVGHKATPALPMAQPPTAPAPGLKSVRILRTLGQAEKAGFLPPPLVASLAAEWEDEE